MFKNGKEYPSIRLSKDAQSVIVIDQRFLPFRFEEETITTFLQMAEAITDMHVRGAPLIGASAAFGVYLAALEAVQTSDPAALMEEALRVLRATRPTAVNLHWALGIQKEVVLASSPSELVPRTKETALKIAREDKEMCRSIGEHGARLIEKIYADNGNKPVQILTHCNAGSLATVEYGTATAPLYIAHERGIPLHVWVDETRPRNQGRLTAWELSEAGIDATVIADNTGGHLMQHGMVDLAIVGADRVTAQGDAANKIGTYLKALAAKASAVPFYVAFPSSTIDWSIRDGLHEIPIEERDENEVLTLDGLLDGKTTRLNLFAEGTKAANYAFDVTPYHLITGLITEKGICLPSQLEEFYGKKGN